MLNYIWITLILIGYIVAFFTGKTDMVTNALLESTSSAVTLVIGLTGAICFWSGIMQIASDSGMVRIISKITSPFLNLLFKNIPNDHPAKAAISLNLVADMLGIGNAATPFGITAVKQMNTLNPTPHIASDDIIMFLILNTCTVQLVPSTIVALRLTYHSADAVKIIPIIWISSLVSCIVGVAFTKVVIAIINKFKKT